ncbi:hypothetical protein [Aureimonas frigidaquae]|uniref:hypothetical protein n=1 Tax=Aureimonas frigidaquae TaxID=424757 RepID=UPI0012ED3466|nr:hypothetical protein [Aureimonas frigidaquae]
MEGATGAPVVSNTVWSQPEGFSKWRVVHAEFTAPKSQPDELDGLLAHLVSGKGRRFTLRCGFDSDDFESLNDAYDLDGDPAFLIGKSLLMSVGDAPRRFMRAGPLPWSQVRIVSVDANVDGSARINGIFDFGESAMQLSSDWAAGLAAVCGGDENVVGSRVSYRLMPDDSVEWRLIPGDLVANSSLREEAA